MTTLLKIDNGLFGANSVSNGLTAAFVEAFTAARPDGQVLHRDLAVEPMPHLDATAIQGFMAEAGAGEGAAGEARARSDAAIAELEAADAIVIGMPMYNFNVPSAFKAWFDHVARAGVTFRYTANGPEGLLKGKKVYVLGARGGRYSGTGNDFQEPYLRQILGFVGLDDVTFVYAEGLKMGEAVAAEALAAARSRIADLASELAAAPADRAAA